MRLQGKFYSKKITTGSEVVGQDLFTTIESDLGINVVAKKLTIASSGSLSIDINNGGVYYELSDHSGSYVLNLTDGDVYVSSLKIKESGRTVYTEIVY